ncbi:hypothetical protein BT93_J0407 [Corymbia citriodora subsp. variegata]|nr:hypothetical protein BT93_J0407 [Corymbia citriodora subsp. variegata]
MDDQSGKDHKNESRRREQNRSRPGNRGALQQATSNNSNKKQETTAVTNRQPDESIRSQRTRREKGSMETEARAHLKSPRRRRGRELEEVQERKACAGALALISSRTNRERKKVAADEGRERKKERRENGIRVEDTKCRCPREFPCKRVRQTGRKVGKRPLCYHPSRNSSSCETSTPLKDLTKDSRSISLSQLLDI